MLISNYAANTAASTLMISSNNQPSDDLARLTGAGLVTVGQSQNGRRFAGAKINCLNGGDLISAKSPHTDAW